MVIDFDDITVQEILIPRVDMLAVDVNEPVDKMIPTVLANSYTRIPVYENDIDHIIGMLYPGPVQLPGPEQARDMCAELCRDGLRLPHQAHQRPAGRAAPREKAAHGRA